MAIWTTDEPRHRAGRPSSDSAGQVRPAARSTSWRAAGVGALTTTALAMGCAALAHHGVLAASGTGALGVRPVPDAFEVLVALLSAALCAFLAALTALGTVAVVPGAPCSSRRWALRLAPRWAPRAAAVLLTVGLGTPTAQGAAVLPAPAASLSAPEVVGVPGPSPDPAQDVTRADPAAPEEDDLPVPGWRPTPPVVAPQPVALLSRGSAEEHLVTVVRGDTLWAIAARHLGGDASAEEIAQAWPLWYAVNRSVIGADPHLILPGQQLRPPAAADQENLP